MLLIVGIGQVWGETYSYTFTAKQFSANGSKTLNSVSWTLAGNGNYWGYEETKGQQFGSGSAPYKTLTLSTSGISGTITKIIINTSGAKDVNASFTVSVGGTQWGNSTITNAAEAYTFTGSNSGEIKFLYTQTSSKALYIKSISVTYETATKLATPTNLKVSNVTTTSATLSWDAVTNASSYTVTVGSTTHSANTNFISLNNLTPSTTYKWSVVAKGNGSTYTDSESAKGSDFTTDTPKKYTVTWMVDKETLSTEDVYENGKVSTVPTVTELPCGDKFVGWTTDPITTPQNKAPEVFTTVAGSPTITKATTFYAVFADYVNE